MTGMVEKGIIIAMKDGSGYLAHGYFSSTDRKKGKTRSVYTCKD